MADGVRPHDPGAPPWPHDPGAALGPGTGGWLGRSLPRREDARLVTGRARFLGDLWRPGVLHCVFVRSTEAHGRLGPVSLGAVREAPGVVAAFAAADLGLADIPGSTGRGPQAPAMRRPVLPRDRVRYVGEPVAAVVARTREAGEDAAERLDLAVEPEEVVAGAGTALTDRVLLFPEAGTNVVARTTLPERAPGPGPGAWPVRVVVETCNQRLAPAPIEPLGILAEPDAGGVTVHCGHQAPHRLRDQLARLLRLDPASVRVVVPEVGGAFGLKGMLFPEYLVVVAAALRLGRPVLWSEARHDRFLVGTHGRGQRHRVVLGGDERGRIRAARVEILADLGAYPHNGSAVPLFTRYLAGGPYAIDDLQVTTTMVVTNRAPTGSYRGAGRPEAAYAIERAVDAWARAAGLDPAEVRRRNFVRPRAMPYRTPTGALYDGGDYARALDLALELADADGVRSEQLRRLAAGRDPVGLGIGAFVERAGGAVDSSEYARVELGGDGRPLVRVGTSAAGQGHETVWAQVAAEALAVDPDEVTVVAGDTAAVRHGVGTFASRSAQVAGSAVWRMASEVRERARRVAAGLLEADPLDVRLAAGRFHVAGSDAVGVGLGEVAARAARAGVELAAEESYSPHAQTFPYGVHVAVAEVELATGAVTVRRLVAVDDCGRVLNPAIVEGQVHGSLLQGAAQALYEGIGYAADGQPELPSVGAYPLPAAPDAPACLTGRLVTPAPSNPLGAKGAGESGCIGAPPAIVNAVLDALRPYGVADLAMPLTPERVWRALAAARAARARQAPGPAREAAR